MLKKTFAPSLTLLVAASLVFLTPGPSHAAARGGFHGGGFHGGGFRAGGYHGGGYRYGGFYRGGYNYRRYYGGYNYGSRYYRPYYGYYPYYNYYYPYSISYPYDYSYGSLGSAYDPGYSSSYYQPVLSSSDSATSGGLAAASYQPSSVSTSPTLTDTSAHITVTVPAGAQLSFDDTPMTSTGTVREFDSPPLTPGGRYAYDVKATWNENGHEVTRSQRIEFAAGAHVNVRFPAPPRTVGQTSAVGSH